MTAGTPSYMAPEQAMGVTPLDKRVDIYSLTAVTYAMLTGHPPFLVRSIADILARDISRPPDAIAQRLGAPATLDAIMISGLAADRNRRRPRRCSLLTHWRRLLARCDPAGTAGRVPNGSVIAGHSPRNQLPTANEITRPDLPPVPKPSAMSPPPAAPLGFEPPRPHSSPPAYQPARNHSPAVISIRQIPHAVSQLTTAPPEVTTASRPFPYYILLAVSALALFAISMFVTILVLR